MRWVSTARAQECRVALRVVPSRKAAQVGACSNVLRRYGRERRSRRPLAVDGTTAHAARCGTLQHVSTATVLVNHHDSRSERYCTRLRRDGACSTQSVQLTEPCGAGHGTDPQSTLESESYTEKPHISSQQGE